MTGEKVSRKITRPRPPANRRKTGGAGRFKKGMSGSPATQFKKGQSGNPTGRPRKFPGTDALREILDDPKKAKQLAASLFRAACKGNPRAFKEILDRVEGKVANRIELSGIEGEAIQAKVDAKLSVNDLLGALRVIYGLNSDPGKAADLQHVQ